VSGPTKAFDANYLDMLRRILRKQKMRGANRGFSLIETVFGVGLFAVSLFAILGLIGMSLNLSEYSQNRENARNDTRRVLEGFRQQIEASAFGLDTLSGQADWPTYVQSTLGITLGLNQEAVQVTFRDPAAPITPLPTPIPSPLPDPVQIEVQISWQEEGKTSIYELATIMTKRTS